MTVSVRFIHFDQRIRSVKKTNNGACIQNYVNGFYFSRKSTRKKVAIDKNHTHILHSAVRI